MQCSFHHLWNYFIDYSDNPVPDGAVIYAGNVPFQYNEQEEMYREFLGNPTGNICLATSRNHEFLLSDKGNMPNILNNSTEPTKFNIVENSINLIQIMSPIPSDPLHTTYNGQNRDAQAEYLAIVKTALRNSIKDFNFTDQV